MHFFTLHLSLKTAAPLFSSFRRKTERKRDFSKSLLVVSIRIRHNPLACALAVSVAQVTHCYCGNSLVYASDRLSPYEQSLSGVIFWGDTGKADSSVENLTHPKANSNIITSFVYGYLKPEKDFSDHLICSLIYKWKIQTKEKLYLRKCLHD